MTSVLLNKQTKIETDAISKKLFIVKNLSIIIILL